jgi:hypothetical protein
MARPSAKRRQKKLQRKAAKRKTKRQGSVSPPKGRRAQIRAASGWPLHECLLTKDWQDTGQLTQILVARRSPARQIAVGAFMVDLGCLGVKAAFGRLFDTEAEYEELRNEIRSRQNMVKADVDLVAKIIREAIAYAKALGFQPDPGYRDAMLVVGDADADACEVSVPLGKDGKPFFIAGPDDRVHLIITKLARKLGPDGFTYIAPVGGDLLTPEE